MAPTIVTGMTPSRRVAREEAAAAAEQEGGAVRPVQRPPVLVAAHPEARLRLWSLGRVPERLLDDAQVGDVDLLPLRTVVRASDSSPGAQSDVRLLQVVALLLG